MEFKLNTFNLEAAGHKYIAQDLCDPYPFEEKYPTIGIYCLADDAIEIIGKLQARIAELEAEKG